MKHLRFLPLLSGTLILAACASPKTTPRPQSTLTIFDAPPIVTATVSGIPSPEITPLPTLSFPVSMTTQELHQRLDPFTNPPEGCVLPCYNGLKLGQSDVYDVYNFYAALGIGVPDLIPGDFPAVQKTGTGRLGAALTKTSDAFNADQMGLSAPQMAIFMQDNIAQSLYLSWGYYPPYLTVPQILGQMGQPGTLNLGLMFDQDPPAYLLTMVYPDLQTGFAFYGVATKTGPGLQVCLNHDQVANTSMAIVKTGDTPLGDIRFKQYLLPLIDTVGLSYEDFSGALSSTSCIEIPASTWDQWKSISGS